MDYFHSRNFQTRIHPLVKAPSPAWIKRDDELGFGVTGSKLRKWESVLQFLINEGVEEVLIEGGPASNNIISAAQLLRPLQIKMQFAFRSNENRAKDIQGNRFLLELLTYQDERMWLGKVNDEDYQAFLTCWLKSSTRKRVIIPEGASFEPALEGAIGLGLDLARNEKEVGITFERVFIDSGTGLTAIGAMMGMALCKRHPKFEIILVAGDHDFFSHQVKRFLDFFGKELTLPPWQLHRPKVAASFGSTSRQGFDFISSFAKSEGVLLDPIYTGKLFQTAYSVLSESASISPSVIIHTGGGTSLFGFCNDFNKR